MDLSWREDLYHLVKNKKNKISYRNSSAASRRIRGQYGSDRNFYGYRTILLYFQMNPNYSITTVNFDLILDTFKKFTDPGKTDMRRFLPIYFNDPEGSLVPSKKLANNNFSVIEKFKEYSSKNAENFFQYSQKLTEVNPSIYIYAKKEFPDRKDLCVFFFEENTLSVSEEVKKELEWMRNNAVWISFKNDEIINISDQLPDA
jgi:hypothetical protein